MLDVPLSIMPCRSAIAPAQSVALIFRRAALRSGASFDVTVSTAKAAGDKPWQRRLQRHGKEESESA